MFFLIILLVLVVFVGFVWWQRRSLAHTNADRARAMLEQRQPVTTVPVNNSQNPCGDT